MIHPGPQPGHPASFDPAPVSTARAVAAHARAAFPPAAGGGLLRRLQHYRPYISPFETLLAHVPPGASVLDVGCGGGLWLRVLEAEGRVSVGVGFDSALPAIALARASRPATARRADLRFLALPVQAPWPGPPEHPARYDAVTIIDVLHHVPPAAQAAVIAQAAARVAPGGVLLYKDMVARPRWRAWANRLHDLALARQWIHYAPIARVIAWARDAGLALEHQSTHTRLWYGHDLLVFRRPRVDAASPPTNTDDPRPA